MNLKLCAVFLMPLLAAAHGSKPPLTLETQGSFFIGGDKKTITQPGFGPIPTQQGDITINQMYVQYQIPKKAGRHLPVVMIHGCCLSGKTWETTPDGREGWSEYFLRKGRAVYLVDQVARARSGFDPTALNEVRLGAAPPSQMPVVVAATHQVAWSVFRFGPRFGEVFPDQKFPMQALEEFYKQLVPDLNGFLPQESNPTWSRLAELGAQLNGAILMGHSQSGFFPQRAALLDSRGVKAMISIEPLCEGDLSPQHIATLAKIPTLIMFGDHLGDVVEGPTHWPDAFARCSSFLDRLRDAGGDATMLHLPALGLKGNSHMLMQDSNSEQLADLVIAWIDRRKK